MYLISLNDNRVLGCKVYEIMRIPNYVNLSEDEAVAQEINWELFYRLLIESYRYCVPGSTVLELLWSSQSIDKERIKGQLHLYVIIRIIEEKRNDISSRMKILSENIIFHLKAGGFEIAERELEKLQEMTDLAAGGYVNGIVKAEQCITHSQAMMPYYFVQSIKKEEMNDFSMLSRAMLQMPGSAIAIQVIPDNITEKEAFGITEMYSSLDKIVSGNIMMGLGITYQDVVAKTAQDSFQYMYENLQQPHFRYNFLAFGNRNQCANLSAVLITMLKGKSTEQYMTINLNSERISMREMIAYYPWNLNAHLIRRYRKKQLWNVLGNMSIMRILFRIPYMITAEEGASLFRIPIDNKKIVGIRSREIVQNVHAINEKAIDTENIQIGYLVGEENKINIGCPKKSMTRHALVVGMPGTGKTTFSINLLLQMYQKKIPFLAIEPTKTEYRAMIDVIPELQIFTPGNNGVSPFVINPFIPPRGIAVEQYIPSLASAFKATFSMPSPLDSIFQEAIQETYVKYGWKDYSTAEDVDVTLFGLHEFILVFKKLVEREKYSADVKGNLRSGGIVRLRNLIEQNPNIYDTIQTVPLEDMLSKPTVLELNAIDDEEQKSVLMALLLINICVYTKHNNAGDGVLKNLILIDEAHVLFNAQIDENGNHGGRSTVRSLENMLAEIRSYGTGIVIADQSPAAVGNEVVKNTDVKIAFRLVDINDRKAISSTTSMERVMESQIPKLDVGQAFVSYALLKEPVLVQTPDIRGKENIRLSVSNNEIHSRMTYWDTHSQFLIPFRECEYSASCTKCSMRLRSDAAFYATRFMQDFGDKIADTNSLCSYIKAVDSWLDKKGVYNDNRITISNCIKIRVIRKVMC